MQNLSNFCLLFIMLLKMAAMPIAILDYSVNRNFIASTLCENKGNPEIRCFGKCYLKKQLTNNNDSQESQDQKNSSKNVITDFFEAIHKPSFACPNMISLYGGQFRETRPGIAYVADIFHPPLT